MSLNHDPGLDFHLTHQQHCCVWDMLTASSVTAQNWNSVPRWALPFCHLVTWTIPFSSGTGTCLCGQSLGARWLGCWGTQIQYTLRLVLLKKKIAKNVSWLLHRRANWRIVFLCSGFTLGLWNHIHCLSCFWTECQFFTLAHNTHLSCCVGSYPLPFRGCPSVTCNCRSSSSYTLMFTLQLTSGGRPHYYVSYRRNAFAQMKLPKYALPKVWPASISLFQCLLFFPRTLSVSRSYLFLFIPHLCFSSSLLYFPFCQPPYPSFSLSGPSLPPPPLSFSL